MNEKDDGVVVNLQHTAITAKTLTMRFPPREKFHFFHPKTQSIQSYDPCVHANDLVADRMFNFIQMDAVVDLGLIHEFFVPEASKKRAWLISSSC